MSFILYCIGFLIVMVLLFVAIAIITSDEFKSFLGGLAALLCVIGIIMEIWKRVGL